MPKSLKPTMLDREDSLEASDILHEPALDLPPGRMNALRGKERLTGSGSPNLTVPPSLPTILRKKVENASPRSSRSPSMRDRATHTASESNSSMSSLEDIIDQDILLDRQGFCELDMTAEQRKMHNSRDCINLPPVNERMTEDTMEDVHAFSDVRSSNASSRANSIVGSMGTGGEGMLEALDECEEEEDDLSDIDEEEPAHIIVTNMENLDLQQRTSSALRVTGESSEVGEAPSAPTA
jgi:hypothetical protein